MTLLGTPWAGKLDAGSDAASGPLMESWLNAIQVIIDGNIDFNNVLVGGNIPLTALATGTLQHNAGSSVKRKFMRGIKTIAPGAVNFYQGANALLTFITDTQDPTGATAFKAATVPIVIATVVGRGAASAGGIIVSISTPTVTTCQLQLQSADNATNLPASVVVHWMAIGEEA